MNLVKTLTIGVAALGWLTLAGQASAAPSRSSSQEAKYAAATSYESGRSSRHRSGRSAYAPRRMESRCDARGGRLIQGRGGEWRCIVRGGRTVYTPRGRHVYVTKGGRTIYAPRGTIHQERGMRGGRSAYEPLGGRSKGRSAQSPKGAEPRSQAPARQKSQESETQM